MRKYIGKIFFVAVAIFATNSNAQKPWWEDAGVKATPAVVAPAPVEQQKVVKTTASDLEKLSQETLSERTGVSVQQETQKLESEKADLYAKKEDLVIFKNEVETLKATCCGKSGCDYLSEFCLRARAEVEPKMVKKAPVVARKVREAFRTAGPKGLSKLDLLRKALGEDIQDLQAKIDDIEFRLGLLAKRVDRLEPLVDAHTTVLNDHEERLSTLEKQPGAKPTAEGVSHSLSVGHLLNVGVEFITLPPYENYPFYTGLLTGGYTWLGENGIVVMDLGIGLPLNTGDRPVLQTGFMAGYKKAWPEHQVMLGIGPAVKVLVEDYPLHRLSIVGGPELRLGIYLARHDKQFDLPVDRTMFFMTLFVGGGFERTAVQERTHMKIAGDPFVKERREYYEDYPLGVIGIGAGFSFDLVPPRP